MCADIRDGQGQLLPSKGRIQMSKTNYLQAVISDLQRTAGPYRCAKSCREQMPHSITLSARASRLGETVRPSAFAALRLMSSWNLTGAWTGSSFGFAPLRMRST